MIRDTKRNCIIVEPNNVKELEVAKWCLDSYLGCAGEIRMPYKTNEVFMDARSSLQKLLKFIQEEAEISGYDGNQMYPEYTLKGAEE